ncbi:MAG: undecaprenyl diphosphate synthase family protein [Methanosarcinales archaeon]|jgi:undecaprenyl diphosphate synthase|nr:undecaprenyl diphosphate synthase family protein [Methanosarcinales archaeon]
MTQKDEDNELKTLLLILNESDLLDPKSISNLFSRFSVIENEGIENLIVYVDFLKTIDEDTKRSLISFFKRQMQSSVAENLFSSERFKIIENYENNRFCLKFCSESVSEDLSVLFVFGVGGRDELKRILSNFIDSCRSGEVSPSAMTSEYISSRLKLPFEPDLIISHSKHTLTDFMIWQTVYSEYYFFEKDISRITDSDFRKAFDNFYKRERRYGA